MIIKVTPPSKSRSRTWTYHFKNSSKMLFFFGAEAYSLMNHFSGQVTHHSPGPLWTSRQWTLSVTHHRPWKSGRKSTATASKVSASNGGISSSSRNTIILVKKKLSRALMQGDVCASSSRAGGYHKNLTIWGRENGNSIYVYRYLEKNK